MKIGIVTYHRPHNYGALLQAYSLKTYIARLGHNVEIIDYWPLYHSAIYKLFHNFSKLKLRSKIKKIALTVVGILKIYKRISGYSNFCTKFLGLHRKPAYSQQTSLASLNYDLIIYGSDQIWRKQKTPLFEGFDDVYFGEHIPSARKVTYAASMGVININEHDRVFIKKALKNFNTLSVREAALKTTISELTDKEVVQVLDPVFLNGKEEWLKLIPANGKKHQYVLLFKLLNNAESVILADTIAEYSGCSVIEIPGTNVNPLLIGSRYKQTESPLGFLSLIYNASFIVTSSFHAVAFSLLFEKQFYAIGLKDNSDRVLTLLSNLGIKQRYLNNLNEIDYKEKINYNEVTPLLKKQIEYSSNYLNNVLNENYQLRLKAR